MPIPADPLRLGYVTNGLAYHRLLDAIDLLADSGYDGVAITLDHHHLDPFGPDLARQAEAVSARLGRYGMGLVIETGARFLLSARHKHQPTLLSDAGRDRRLDFLKRAIALGADLGAEAVSLWSGSVEPGVSKHAAWQRLVSGCEDLLEAADRYGMRLGFEPEPGMLVDRLEGYARLLSELGNPAALGLTLDVGHCRCLENSSIPECIRSFGERLVQIHIEDMRRGVHEHLFFGDGEIDFPPVLAAISEVEYRGLVCVELSRHSHEAPTILPRAAAFLRRVEQGVLT